MQRSQDTRSQTSPQKPMIILVESHPALSEALKSVLESRLQCSVECFDQSNDAINRVEELVQGGNKPAAVLVAEGNTGMILEEFGPAVKKINSSIPTVLLASITLSNTPISGLDWKFTKPFEPNALLTLLKPYVDRARERMS